MALTLKHVPARQGAVWVRDGLRTFMQRPFAFTGLFALFMLAATLLMAVPLVGETVALAGVPLLSMGYMIATRSVLQRGPVHPGQLVEGLRGGDAGQRRGMVLLCIGYALASGIAFELSEWGDAGSLSALQEALSRAGNAADAQAALADPLAWRGILVLMLIEAVISVPFWHAPALVHWGSQGPAQALFSSTLALWRNRGAFAVYALAWGGVIGSFLVVTTLLLALLGLPQLVGLLMIVAGLAFTAAFYVSLLFTFNDSFGTNGSIPAFDEEPPSA